MMEKAPRQKTVGELKHRALLARRIKQRTPQENERKDGD
jgi:hypothetical protein